MYIKMSIIKVLAPLDGSRLSGKLGDKVYITLLTFFYLQCKVF
jgi:hypothetical protein